MTEYGLHDPDNPSKPLATLTVSLGLRGYRGTGIYAGKKIDFSIKKKGFGPYTISIRPEGYERDWGTFQAEFYLDPPAVLRLSDGREYNLVRDGVDKFRLYTNDGRTVLVTTLQHYSEFKSYVEIFDIREREPDFLLLALVSFFPTLLLNGQNAGIC